MMPLDIGIETALNAGAPAPASARDASGASTAADSEWSGRAGGAAAERPPSFHAMLHAAAGTDKSGAATIGPAHPAEAPAVPPAAAQTLENGDSEDSDLQVSGATGMGLWSLLMQALQAMLSDAQAGISLPGGSGEAAEIRTIEDGIPPDISEFLDQLQQLRQSADGVSVDPATLTGRTAELPEKFKALVDNASARLLPQELGALLRELREHLRGLASEGPADDPRGIRAGTMETTYELEGLNLPGPDALVAEATRRAAGGPEIPLAGRGARAEIRAGQAGAGDGRSLIAAGDASSAPVSAAAPVKTRAQEPDSTSAGVSSAVALRAAPRHEGVRSSVVPESSRSADAVSDGSEKIPDGQPDPPADSGDFRQAAEDFLFSKASALDAAPEEGTVASERFALAPREAHPPPGAEGGSGRSADAAEALRDKETAAGTVRNGIFDQIVQRAVVQVGNDHGEINIDLKPDFLGRVRMQIMTENQQLSVRILTDLPAVRDMIETGLQQLKSELQSHGLQVERLEVAMANDHRQQEWQQAKASRTWKTDAPAEVSATDRLPAEGRWEPVGYRPRPVGAAAIDMFV